ncbi:tRNA uridine-5-carboxymethylaminomethyl(34) synthesis GTPase MnmE [Acetobacterium paludosum]|uniref:tRNA modification GTPase MnmE n=1 Tax=Acetobacterium paludosum TaxID=52693 RepID=A0A923KXK6_9FIRM|nr:tRNA uridine-5-carboxymethylaminomethyl(34) synthesis GTPase MnmE [Acetobacterium paludosum]MBC3888471.1 tRNA uridine-5-carboxymethylaminomethyl(34) synthesis GTPase MnmE [Acetobacterium paludosum]
MEVLLVNEGTIAAVATGMGGAGIGIIRISGNKAIEIGNNIFINPKGKTLEAAKSHELLYGRIVDPITNKDIDEVLISKMKTPHSYTAEDIVEINCHGGIVPMRKILKLVIKSGARLAEPGEFTKRAFLNGRIDLTQAEAVMDIINAKTEKSLEYSVAQLEGRLSEKLEELDVILVAVLSHMEVNIDYPEYDIEEITYEFIHAEITKLLKKIKEILIVAETGKIYREGITTAILGEPNVGKSSLLNTFLMENKAIVTDVPGTTRDMIEEYINIEGIPFKIIDTAGIRETDNVVEKIGVEKSKALLNQTNLVIFMRDISKEISPGEKELLELLKNRKTIYIANKTDTLSEKDCKISAPWIPMSLIEESGIEILKKKMIEMVYEGTVNQEADYLITNTRHIQLLEETKKSLENAIVTMKSQMPIELVSIDIMEALESLRGITGKAVGMDIIDQIFKNFCIGK